MVQSPKSNESLLDPMCPPVLKACSTETVEAVTASISFAIVATTGNIVDLFAHHLRRLELKQYPSLRVDVGNAAIELFDGMKEESKKATLELVEMENSYLTVDFFLKLP
ncbi:hypothetical protein OROHE_005059 [Orobanche hederae]